jgi:hypothetical protein
MSYQYPGFLASMMEAPRRKVFVSYYHAGDQWYYNELSRLFAASLEVFEDTSLDRRIQSESTDYVRWAIRQNNIVGSSCTIVLCGARTHERKYVDWEVKATLDERHGLVGLWLPTLPLLSNGGTQKPDRLQDNIDSGYAKWLRWDGLTADVLKATIEAAVGERRELVRNDRAMRQRNG